MKEKVEFKGSVVLNPVPVVLITSKNKEGKENVFTVGWIGTVCTKPPMLSISIRPERLSYEYIKETMEFTVNLPSIDMTKAFFQSRYDKGDGSDYLNCPLSEEEYDEFYKALISAERAPVHGFDVADPKVYEGCMPVEVMAKRGVDTLRFGPMKPVGLRIPETGKRPFAVIQLRKENSEGTLYNMVGFQTNLKFGEQKRVFSIVPALKNLEIIRYGVMHRNTFIDSPRLLSSDYSMRENSNLFFAGQITGVEGYMESVSSGLIAGINAAFRLLKKDSFYMPQTTIMGALSQYISDENVLDFQPMGANFGIISPLNEVIKDKKMRYNEFARRSIDYIKSLNVN